MKIEAIRKMAGKEEIDYQFLMSALSGYSHPRDKISTWLASGELIRIKKGLYVFGKEAAINPYSFEVLANLIYGPSAISLNYALAYYGLIPEKVTTITSITSKKNKSFSTPIGEFTYRYLNSDKYPIDIELAQNANKNYFLMASKEKALCDYIHLIDKKVILTNMDNLYTYLLHDLRIDENELKTLNANKLSRISNIYQDSRLTILSKLIKSIK